MRDRNKLANKTFRQELLDRYDGAKKCVCCGEAIDEPIWHHILPCRLGGGDLVTNIVPVCHACHQAIHNMKPNIYYRFKSMGKVGGRKVDYKPEYDDIFEDYVRCRISRSEASARLNKGIHFKENKAFKEFMQRNNILRLKNRLDIILSKHENEPLKVGTEVGSIEYMDGRIEYLYWGMEEAKSGASEILTEEPKIEEIEEADEVTLEEVTEPEEEVIPIIQELLCPVDDIKVNKEHYELEHDAETIDWWKKRRKILKQQQGSKE